MKRIFILLVFLSVGCQSCEKSGRTDAVKNEALENLCSGSMILEVMAKDKQIAREMHCRCGTRAVKSDANNCETIINLNNSLKILKECKDLSSNSDCRRVFAERK